MDESLVKALMEDGLRQYALNEQQISQLVRYLKLLNKWNKTYNLTAIRDPLEMVRLHIFDSLSVLPYIRIMGANSLLDVGAGAGLPSIPLAICMPDLKVFAIDKVQKKTSFMQQVKAELGLKNFNALHGRVETMTFQDFEGESMSVIVSRAFSELALFVSLTKHLIASNGCWLAMKGVAPYSELTSLESMGGYKATVTPLNIETLAAERHLVEIRVNG